jgi:hypothetical protein
MTFFSSTAILFALTFCHAASSVLSRYTLSIKLNHFPPFTPLSRAFSIVSVQIEASAHPHLIRLAHRALSSSVLHRHLFLA